MTERDALMRTICSDPLDDAPRLVFADWLDENGEPERAEYIRRSVARSHLDDDPAAWVHDARIARLRERFGNTWPAGLPTIHGVDFADDRGFPSVADFANVATLTAHADEVFAAAPITSLSIGVESLIAGRQLRRFPHFRQVRRLRLRSEEPARFDLPRLLALPDLAGLRELDIGEGISFDAFASQIAECEARPALERLAVAGCRFTPVGWIEFADAALLANLRSLRLEQCRIESNGMRQFLASPHLGRLRSFGIVETQLSSADIKRLAAREWPELRSLRLESHGMTVKMFRWLASEPPPRLRALSLARNYRFGTGGLGELADSERFGELSVLDVNHCGIGARGVAELCASPVASRLACLDLGRNPIGAAGVRALVSAEMPSLRWLNLCGCPFGDAELGPLLDAPWLSSLMHLDLTLTDFSPLGKQALIERLGDRVLLGGTL